MELTSGPLVQTRLGRLLPPRRSMQSNAGDDLDFQPLEQSKPAAPQATISANEPSVWQRVKNAFTEGIPRYSSRTVYNPKYGQMQIASPEEAMTPTEQQHHPIRTGIGEVAGGLTSPENTALLAGTGGLGDLPAVGRGLGLSTNAARLIPRVVGGGFSLQMLKSAYDQMPQFRKALDAGDTSEAMRLATHIVSSGVLGYLAGRHAVKSGGAPAPATAETEEAAPAPAFPAGETINGEPVRTRFGPRAQPLITPAPPRTLALPAPRGPEPDGTADFLAGKPVRTSPDTRDAAARRRRGLRARLQAIFL